MPSEAFVLELLVKGLGARGFLTLIFALVFVAGASVVGFFLLLKLHFRLKDHAEHLINQLDSLQRAEMEILRKTAHEADKNAAIAMRMAEILSSKYRMIEPDIQAPVVKPLEGQHE